MSDMVAGDVYVCERERERERESACVCVLPVLTRAYTICTDLVQYMFVGFVYVHACRICIHT